MNNFMNFDDVNITNIGQIVDFMSNILKNFNQKPVLVGVGNHNIIVDKLGYETAKKCISHHNIPISVYGVQTEIVPQTLDSYIKFLSFLPHPKIVVDSAIGSVLGRVTISCSPATVGCLSSPKTFGDVSILITTVTKNNNISTLDIIKISDLLSYAISQAVDNVFA